MEDPARPLLKASAALVVPAAQAFLDGEGAAAVHAEAARLLRDLAALEDRLLADPTAAGAAWLATTGHAEALARSALRLADLAALRPRGQLVASLREPLQRQLADVRVLCGLAGGATSTRPGDAAVFLGAVRAARRDVLRDSVATAGADPRLVTTSLAVTAAAQRLEEAAEQAAAAAQRAVLALA